MERRQSYRVKVEDHDQISVSLEFLGRARIEGELVDLNRRGAGVRIAADRAPHTERDRDVAVHFMEAQAGALPPISAHIRSIIFTPGYCRYGLRFDPHLDLSRCLPVHLLAYFNQRIARRVRPTAPLTVELRNDDGQTLEGIVRDLSWSGMSVTIAASCGERALLRGDGVELQLLLPTHKAPIQLAGVISRDLLVDDRISYGIHFDPRRTPEFAKQQTRLKRYLAHCHLERRARAKG